jgi:hypothetical protein
MSGARALLFAAAVGSTVAAGSGMSASGQAHAAPAAEGTRGECTPDGRRCLYRSMLPSAGLVADCPSDTDCRVGYYYGDPARATWLEPPSGMRALPRPVVIWRTATLAEARFDCGRACAFSYFFEARRRRISPPRRSVLEVDPTRLLLAAAEDRALVIRQVFSGREVTRIDRDWAPGWVGDAVTGLRFDADGRLALTWLQGTERRPVTERVSVPSMPRSREP